MAKYRILNTSNVRSWYCASDAIGQIVEISDKEWRESGAVHPEDNRFGINFKKSDFQLISNKTNMKNNKKTLKSKAVWKVGDVVYNDYNSQKSTVLAVEFDKESESFKYLLRCQEDEGSLHLIYESSISEIEVEEKTVAQLKAYYEENESVEVKIVK